MRTFNLSDWRTYFPDGISLAAYQLIRRLIRRYGEFVQVACGPGDHAALSRELSRLASGRKVVCH
jgi:hypothetical protein